MFHVKGTRRRARRALLASAVGAVAAGLFLAPDVARAQISDAEIAAAKADGAVSVYYCDSAMKDIVENFSKTYPDITVTTYLDNCLKVYSRYAREASARRSIADVFLMTEDVLDQLQSDGQLLDYAPAERANYPASAKPEGARYTLIKTLVYGMAAASSVPQPKDWTDFGNPPAEWKNRIIYFDPRTSTASYTNLAALEQNLGRDETGKIFAGMREAGAELSASSSAGLAKILSGEKDLSFYVLSNQFLKLKRQGAKLEFRIPASGTMSLPFGLALPAKPSHEAAAKLFAQYILTDGADALASNDEYSLRNGAPPPAGMPPLSEIKFMPTDLGKALNGRDDTIAWWQSVMGLR